MTQWHEMIVIVLSSVVALIVPLVTLWRLRTPEQRRDEWLSANGQRRISRLFCALGITLTALGGAICVLVALAGYPLAWAAFALFVGLLVSTIISACAAFRVPDDA